MIEPAPPTDPLDVGAIVVDAIHQNIVLQSLSQRELDHLAAQIAEEAWGSLAPDDQEFFERIALLQ